jgi:hypothetical protein
VRSQSLQRVTGRWVTVTGKRRERGVLIASHHASPAGVAMTSCSPERTTRGYERMAVNAWSRFP